MAYMNSPAASSGSFSNPVLIDGSAKTSTYQLLVFSESLAVRHVGGLCVGGLASVDVWTTGQPQTWRRVRVFAAN
jgi:hypothetical protein